MTLANFDDYPHFSKHEFDCSHTGGNLMRKEFMDTLHLIRSMYGKPLYVTSGYRSPEHPIEKAKGRIGEHTLGCAADFRIRGVNAIELINIAYTVGIRRIGVQQKGSGRFIHLGMGDQLHDFPASIWSY